MEFGMFHEFPSLPGRSESEAFDEAMEQTDAAERLGGLPKRPRQWISLATASLSLGWAAAAWRRPTRPGKRPAILARGRCLSRCADLYRRDRGSRAPAANSKTASCVSTTSRPISRTARRGWWTPQPPPRAACGSSTSCAASVMMTPALIPEGAKSGCLRPELFLA